MGSFRAARFDLVQSPHLRTPTMQEGVVQRFQDNPSMSTKTVASKIGISYKSVRRVPHYEKMHAFHMQRVQQQSLRLSSVGRFRTLVVWCNRKWPTISRNYFIYGGSNVYERKHDNQAQYAHTSTYKSQFFYRYYSKPLLKLSFILFYLFIYLFSESL